jgi:hypothetical protein
MSAEKCNMATPSSVTLKSVKLKLVGRVTVKVRSQAILAWATAGWEQSGLEALTTQAHTLGFATELSSFGVARAPWSLA